MTRSLTAALLVFCVFATAAPGLPQGLEVQYRPMQPDPILTPMLRPVVPPVEVPSPRVLPLAGTPVASPALPGRTGSFTVVGRELGCLVVRDGQALRAFRLSPLGPPLPADLEPGDRVEIRYGEGDILRDLRRP